MTHEGRRKEMNELWDKGEEDREKSASEERRIFLPIRTKRKSSENRNESSSESSWFKRETVSVWSVSWFMQLLPFPFLVVRISSFRVNRRSFFDSPKSDANFIFATLNKCPRGERKVSFQIHFMCGHLSFLRVIQYVNWINAERDIKRNEWMKQRNSKEKSNFEEEADMCKSHHVCLDGQREWECDSHSFSFPTLDSFRLVVPLSCPVVSISHQYLIWFW